MEPATQLGAMLLMALFGLGVIGCAIAIPICAVRFFAVLYEEDEEESRTTRYDLMPLYPHMEATVAPPPVTPVKDTPSRPRARGATAGASQK